MTKSSLKTTQVLLGVDGQVITKFDIYHGAVAPNCFKSHINSLCPDFLFFFKKLCLISGLKFTLPDVASLLPDNMHGLKKNDIQTCYVYFLKLASFSLILVFDVKFLTEF